MAGGSECRISDFGNPLGIRESEVLRGLSTARDGCPVPQMQFHGPGWGRGDKIWALLGPGAGKADGGSCYWGPRRWGTRPAPPVPSLGLEGNSLLLSRSPGCVWRDWADGSGGGAREGAARGGRPGRRVGGSTCPDPSARRAGGRAVWTFQQVRGRQGGAGSGF